ncbi:LysR family transcriptional regulator [Paraburkholderia sp. C35]|uniref:LysR family transcriptional regulator n=1 Tax=Paraburkholderia sp. C35 TaxID=2126993 RepID=UPI001EF52AE1|nr:LysR family transcriptional regulator [Paraburkholderia sp. C35]
MRMFVKVAEGASFTTAARQLGVAPAQVSRTIVELETHLQTRLLNRTTRRVVLTESGDRYLARCKEMLELVDLSEAEAGNAQVSVSGSLRVHAPITFGQHYVVPALTRYLNEHPRVRVELTLSQHQPDILEEGYDVVLQITGSKPPDSLLVSSPICSMGSVLCASPAYLESAGIPRTLDDLRHHSCLRFANALFPSDRWSFIGLEENVDISLPPDRLRVNAADALTIAVMEGLGIAPVPMLSALPYLQTGAIVRVLPEWDLQPLSVFALYASRQYLDAKIRTWIDFLKTFVHTRLQSSLPQ